MIKVNGTWVVGVDGVTAFEVEPLTAGGAMTALELAIAEHGEAVSAMRLRPYEYAQMVRVNGELLTVDAVLGLTAQDYDVLNKVVGALQKKLSVPTENRPAEKA